MIFFDTKIFSENIRLNRKTNKEKELFDINVTWFVTALLHDIGIFGERIIEITRFM